MPAAQLGLVDNLTEYLDVLTAFSRHLAEKNARLPPTAIRRVRDVRQSAARQQRAAGRAASATQAAVAGARARPHPVVGQDAYSTNLAPVSSGGPAGPGPGAPGSRQGTRPAASNTSNRPSTVPGVSGGPGAGANGPRSPRLRIVDTLHLCEQLEQQEEELLAVSAVGLTGEEVLCLMLDLMADRCGEKCGATSGRVWGRSLSDNSHTLRRCFQRVLCVALLLQRYTPVHTRFCCDAPCPLEPSIQTCLPPPPPLPGPCNLEI